MGPCDVATPRTIFAIVDPPKKGRFLGQMLAEVERDPDSGHTAVDEILLPWNLPGGGTVEHRVRYFRTLDALAALMAALSALRFYVAPMPSYP
jgi:hypothetical protein